MKLPPQLQNKEFRFNLLKEKAKEPLDRIKWKENSLTFDNPTLSKHTGNLGIITGYGNLIVLDCDSQKFAEFIEKIFPSTFTVETARGIQLYYICKNVGCDKAYIKLIGDVGELRLTDCYVVAPGSTHPSGKLYTIKNNVDIAEIDWNFIEHKIGNTFVIEIEKINYDYDNLENIREPDGIPEPDIELLLKADEKLKDLLNGEWQRYDFPSRSEAENSLVTKLCQYNLNKEQVFLLMSKCKIGKWQEAHPNYRELTYKKGLIFANVNPLDKTIMKNTENEVYELRNILKKELPRVEYYIEPMIPKGCIILIGGKAGSFKSMLSLFIGISITTNTKFMKEFKVTTNNKVIIYDLENGEPIIHVRSKYILNGLDLIPDDINGLFVSHDFDKNDIKKEFDKAKKYDIIFLDSYRRFLRGEENSSEITDKFYKEFIKPLRALNKTIIIIHHFRKSRPEEMDDEDVQDLFRGSTDLPAQVDIIYALLKGQENDENSIKTFDVSFVKAKNRLGLPLKDFVITVTKNDFLDKTSINFKRYGMHNPHEKIIEAILNILNSEQKKRSEIFNEIMDKSIRVTIPTFDRILKEMVENSQIEKIGNGIYKSIEE